MGGRVELDNWVVGGCDPVLARLTINLWNSGVSALFTFEISAVGVVLCGVAGMV